KARLQKLKEEKEKNAPKDLPGTITNEDIREKEEVPAPAPVAARAVPVLPTEAPVPKATPISPKAAPTPASPKAAPQAAAVPAKATGSANETFSLEQLKAGVEGIDITLKERYLSDAEFQTVMDMSKDEFAGLPKWKQQAKKKEVGLF
ncbi:Villin-like protein, partial [Phytophthora palmivora]